MGETNKRFDDISTFKRAVVEMIAKSDTSWSDSLGYSFRTRKIKEYTKEDVERIINSGSLRQQQELSRNYFYKDSFYKRIILYYATLLKYIGVLIPNPSAGNDLSKSFIVKRYNNALDYLDKINDFSYDDSILNNKLTNNDDEILLIKEEVDKLTIKRSNATKLFAEDKIDLDSLKEIQSIVDEKLNNLKVKLKELENKPKEEKLDKEQIMKVALNIKNNFLHLTNKERKIFIERFIKEIKVKKEGDDVKILNISF